MEEKSLVISITVVLLISFVLFFGFYKNISYDIVDFISGKYTIENVPDADPSDKEELPGQSHCGDGECQEELGENCATCNVDCGYCESHFCGDEVCDSGETCSSCKKDCGTCKGYCGDDVCNSDESCSICETDCGSCISISYCGDGECGPEETCLICTVDCGVCTEESQEIKEEENLYESPTCLIKNVDWTGADLGGKYLLKIETEGFCDATTFNIVIRDMDLFFNDKIDESSWTPQNGNADIVFEVPENIKELAGEWFEGKRYEIKAYITLDNDTKSLIKSDTLYIIP
ncbi:MAG: hypothetical protein ABIF88_03370 [archaeon]